MPIDARIPLGVQRIRMPDRLQQAGNVLQIQNAQNQNALAQYSLWKAQKDDARAEATRNALATTGGDYDKVRDVLISSGDVAGALTLDKSRAAQAASESTTNLNKLKQTGQQIEIGAQLLGGVTDQASYDAALERATALLGPQAVQGAPAQYDPNWVANMRSQALKAKDAIDIQLKQQTFGETQRHNRATEATAALRAQNSGPMAVITGPDGTVTAVGGPSGINPNAMSALGQARGNIKRAEEEGKGIGKYYGERYADIIKAGDFATLDDDKLTRIEKLLEGVDTGAFKGTTTDLKKAAKAAGMDLEALGITDDVAPVEAARALSNEMALQARNPAGGAGMPGAMSDADRQFLAGMQPGIETTPEGRKLMIQTRKALNKRAREVAKLAVKYRKENGRLDEDFTQVLQDFSEKNPIFHAVTDDASYATVPSGQAFVDPEGVVRVKP